MLKGKTEPLKKAQIKFGLSVVIDRAAIPQSWDKGMVDKINVFHVICNKPFKQNQKDCVTIVSDIMSLRWDIPYTDLRLPDTKSKPVMITNK